MLKSFLIPAAAAVALCAAPACAQTPRQSGHADVIATATTYLHAYENLDVVALADIYAEDADFIDDTSRIMPNPFVWHGREAVLAGIQGWRDDSVEHITYELEQVFESARRVVFIGYVVTDLRGPNGQVRYRYPTVTIVTLRDGLVIEHRDYVDYAAATRVS